MNIFILDSDMQKNVQSYVDKHVVKMPLETCQMLSTTYYFTNQEELAPYKINHPNHPCSIWARESLSNWLWLRDLGLEISKEYTYRYGKYHKCEQIMKDMVIPSIIDIGLTKQPKAMGELINIGEDIPDNIVEAYRKYYNMCKQHLFNWKNRSMPTWIV